ncbi:MAG TPA: malto-oligosyltrehalose trehalohydrolase [Blastocatellia bacterium]|nr:malto-oligosyltrehalose trehalohydrolase [Blastocatellia bacterium]
MNSPKHQQTARRLPVGAEYYPNQGTHFRVYAPQCRTVEVVIESGTGLSGKAESFALEAESTGYFSGQVAAAAAGTLYRFRLDGGEKLFPDPASRFQPQGPHGASLVVDPHTFEWSDHQWRGCGIRGQVIYEMHVGTFTPEGTWAAATEQLPELAALGITVIEMMPVADFPGRFGWGYDGVNLFAPTRLYGEPDDLRRFIDRAHAVGIGVILDVVYNHLGPDGNYLKEFSTDYFSQKHKTEWGEAINYDGDNNGPAREYFLSNAAYWVDEFHFDGLRLDATQSIFDDSEEHILTAIGRTVRAAAQGRETIIVAENEPQHVRLVQTTERGGHGLDALWNDDFHHSAIVALTGRNEAYYTDYQGKPQELISAIKYGYLYQGQWYRWQQQRRGTADLTLPPTAYVNFIQNHDQIANSGRGERVCTMTSPGRYRALTALLLLAPNTPMLFQGQEFAASSPFLYFADFEGDLRQLVREGRKQNLAQFRSLALPETQAVLADPGEMETFTRCKLDFSERERHAGIYQLHRDLLRLRREDAAFRAQRRGGVDGAVLGNEAFVLRFFGTDDTLHDDRLLLVNLGTDLIFLPAPEPLLAPPPESHWEIQWSSEHPNYGGLGTPPLETTEGWMIPGHAAVVLRADKRKDVAEVSLIHPDVLEELKSEEKHG